VVFLIVFFRHDCSFLVPAPRTPIVYDANMSGVMTKDMSKSAEAGLVCVATLAEPHKFVQPIELALSNNNIGALLDFQDQCDFMRRGNNGCYLPIIILRSNINAKKFHVCQHQTNVTSAGALLQQKSFDIHLPLYQLLFQQNTARIMRCWWCEFEDDGRTRTQLFSSPIPSPESPGGMAFDLSRPTEMLKFFLLVVDMLQYLPEAYWNSAFGFQRKVVSGKWPEQIPEARLNTGE
jgi:hypothetical protein